MKILHLRLSASCKFRGKSLFWKHNVEISCLSLIYEYLSVLRAVHSVMIYIIKLCKSLQRPIESNRSQYSFCSFDWKLFSLGDKIQKMSWGYRLLVWQNSLVPALLFVLNIIRYRLVSFLSPLEVSWPQKVLVECFWPIRTLLQPARPMRSPEH